MGEYRNENWAQILLPEGNKEINLSTGEEEKMQPIAKLYECELKDFSEKERAFTAIASTESPDRDGDILRANGWKLKNYRKNPVVLWGHDAYSLPIARAKEINIEGEKMIFRPQFATAEQNPFAEQVFQMFKGGFLRAFSVRFDPIEWKDREPEEGKSSGNGQGARYGRDYKSMELLEISAVNVPANAEALKSLAMHDFLVKSYLTENQSRFPNAAGIAELIKEPLIIKKDFDFTEELKEKYERLEVLQREKELRKVEAEINEQIKSLEDEFANEKEKERAIIELQNKMRLLQDGITGLVKK
jgi:HK97 family phage prohead protease